MYKGSKHQTNTLLSPDTIQCTRGQNIKQILYYPQTLYSVQGVKTSNKYFIIPRHYTVYKGSKHQTNTLLSPDTIQCTRGQNIKQILYYPQTLYSVQGVKTSNKYFIIPRHYTVYKGSKHQTNTLLSPDTIQCTRGQNIKQILYYPQTLYSVQGVKTSNKYFIIPRHYIVYKGSKHQTNTLLSPDTIQCTRGQNIKQILYYPQTLYSVQGVKTSNKYFIIPRHYTVYKGSKHQTNTLLSPDTIQCTRGQNIKQILYYPQTLYSVQGVKTSNKYFIIPRHYTVYKGSKHQTNTLLSPDTIQCTRGQNIKQILYYPQTLYSVQGVKTSNKYFIIPRHYTVYKGSKHQTNTLLSPDTIQCTRGQNIKQILYYPQTLYSVQGVKTSNKYFIIPRHYTVYKGSKHQTNTLLSPDTIQCTRGQNIKQILYYPQTLYSVQGVKTSNKYFIIPRHYTVYKGSKHQTNTLLSPDTIQCTRGQNIKQILYYPQTLYSVQGVKTSNKYFIIPRHYTVYKGSKHQTNTLLSPDTIQCTRGQNIKQILYYPQTLYSVQGVKTSNKYFIIPRHYTVYKGSKHQTNTLLSPDTIQCTRGQNIKQILYYPQTLYSVQGVKTSNKYFIIPRHYTVYKGSKHQTNTLLSPDTIQCTRGQNIKQILYYPQTLYSVQGVKTSNKYFIIPRHYTVYKGSKHQTNTLLSPDTIQCTRGQNIKQILYYPQTLYSVQGVKTSNKYFIIPRHYTVYKGSKHQTNTLLSPDTIQCTRGQNIKQILYYPQTLYSVQGVKTSNKYFIIPRHYTVYKGSKHQTNTLLSPDTIQCTRGQNIKQILYYPQTLYSVQGVKTSNKYFIIPRHYTVYKGSKHQTNTLLSPDTIQCTRGQNIKQILYYPQTLYSVQGVKTSNKYFIIPRHYTVYKGSKHQTNT